MTRAEARAAFAARHGHAEASIAPLAQDASFRSYWRLTGGPTQAVLMDAPPGHEDIRPFLAIAETLHHGGLSAPQIHAADTGQGFILLEDFGDALFPSLLAESTVDPLYNAAVDTLAEFGRLQAPPGTPAWTAPAMTTAAAATFLDWWWPTAFAAPPAPAIRAEFTAAMHEMLAPLAASPPSLVHRDYFAANLFWLPDRTGARRTGVIDFQDAATGSPAYDLVSLVQDARRDLPATLAPTQIARLLAARPELDPDQFHAQFAACAAQRHLRVACLWVRLARRDQKPHYLAHGPRCWRLLADALRHPATAPLAAFLDRHVPPALRANPQTVTA